MTGPPVRLTPPPPLEFRLESSPAGVVRLAVVGEIDLATAGQLSEAAERALTELRPRRLDIDLADVAFLDSTGINALMRIWRSGQENGYEVVVTNPRAPIARVLTLTGVASYLGLPDS